MVRIAVRKDHDIARGEGHRLSILHLDVAAAIDQEMVENEMRRSWSDLLRHQLRRGCREPPGR
jgi:hypothetical protein